MARAASWSAPFHHTMPVRLPSGTEGRVARVHVTGLSVRVLVGPLIIPDEVGYRFRPIWGLGG